MNVVYCVKGRDYARMCERSIDSVLHVYPGTTPFVFVDKCYGLPNETVIRFEAEPFMVSNVYCQTRFTMSGDFDDTTLFLDADVIANEPREIPDDVDLAVTWRDTIGDQPALLQPYNYGVLIANPTLDTKFAFQWLLNHVMFQTPEHQAWFGNQIALRELIGPPVKDPASPISTVTERLFTLEVEHLPCATWNWTPDGPDESIEGKAFIHVKGDRKDLFNHYYTRAA